MFGTPSSSSQRREISEDRAKLDELRYKNKIRDETYKTEIDKLRQKLEKIRYKFERQNTNRQNSQEMQRLKEENLFLKSQFQFQKQQIQQSFQVGNVLQSQRETSAAKRAYSSRSANEKHQNFNYQSSISNQKEINNGTSNKKVIASDMELVKIAQHKLMKENKNLRKRVDIMSSQMRELYELIFDDKAGNQQLQKSQNYKQIKETFKNYSNDCESSSTFNSQLNDQESNTAQSLNQQKLIQFNNGDTSYNYQNKQNNTYRENSDKKNNLSQGNKMLNLSQKSADQNMKFNASAGFDHKIIKNDQVPSHEQNFESQDNQLSGFQEKIELTKSKFIDKIKNVFSKHQKQNEIFENNNKQIKEITKQLFQLNSKSSSKKDQFEKDTKNNIDSSASSITSSASSACIIDKSKENDTKMQQNDQYENDITSNDQSITDDENMNENSKKIMNSNQQKQKKDFSGGQIDSTQIKKQMNFLKKQDTEFKEDEELSADFNDVKGQKEKECNKIPSQQTQFQINKDHSYERLKQQAYLNTDINARQVQNELNVVKLNDPLTKRENAKISDVFFSPKEQYSTLLNKNNENTIKNNTSNKSNLNETTGLSTIINNYLSHTGYVQELPATIRRFDPLSQLQAIKNYPTFQYQIAQYPTSTTMTNYNRQHSNSNYPSQQLSLNSNLNYMNSIEFKNHDISSNYQTQSLLQKFNQTLPSRNIESYKNRNPFELDYKNKKSFDLENIGNQTKISPQKDLTITSRLREELYLNIPSSTQSQSLHQQGQKKNLGNSSAPHKTYEIKLDQLSKAAKLTTPLMSTQREKINDEYIKQIIQQYKTPKKTSISSQQQTQLPQQIYQPTQSFIGLQQKKQNDQLLLEYQNQERNDYSQQSQTMRLYEKDSLSNNQYQSQNILNGQYTGLIQSSNQTQSSPNKFSNNKILIQSQMQLSNNPIKSNSLIGQSNNLYSKDLTIYNCYFNNNSPLQKKIANMQPPLTGASTAQSSYTNRETLNLNHKRQQSCGNTGISGVNKYNLKLNLTSLISPKSSQTYQSDRQNSDRTGYNRLLSKNTGIISSNISPKYSPHSSQTTSVNRFYQK